MDMKLYTDGSTIVKNPSVYGGTYAFIIVTTREVARGSGVITPEEMGTEKVTNNQMELLAVLYGLEAARKMKYKITHVVSDSRVTLGRVFQGWALNNVPPWVVNFLARTPIQGIRGEFVQGHNGDTWNEAADTLAEMEAINFLENNHLEHLIYSHQNPPWKRS